MSQFRIVTHTVPCQHIREYARAHADDQDEPLYLSVKQYIPHDNPNPQPGDVTIIGAHANAIPRELYEPLWDDLLAGSRKQGFRIRGIWIADLAHQGHSGVLNRHLLGNDPSWSDHARDLLHLINVKRDDMPRPIVGIGHSVGGAQLTDLAYIHPRLLTTLVLLDPVVQVRSSEIEPGRAIMNPARSSTFRRDTWPSREIAEVAFNKSPFYQGWDPRIMPLWLKYGLRDVSESEATGSASATDGKSKQVTLTTPPAQETFLFLRPNYAGSGHNGAPVDRTTHPDVDPSSPINSPFYRPEPARIFHALARLRPSTLYLFAEHSYVSAADPAVEDQKVTNTGSGPGGSGGVAAGRVKGIQLSGLGHMFPLESPRRTAEDAAAWIGQEMRRWSAEEDEHEREWAHLTLRDKQTIDERWKREIGGPLASKSGPEAKAKAKI